MRTIKNIIATDFDRVVRPAYAIIEVSRKGQITVWNEFNDLGGCPSGNGKYPQG